MRKRLKELRKEEFCDEYSERERGGSFYWKNTVSDQFLSFLSFVYDKSNKSSRLWSVFMEKKRTEIKPSFDHLRGIEVQH